MPSDQYAHGSLLPGSYCLHQGHQRAGSWGSSGSSNWTSQAASSSLGGGGDYTRLRDDESAGEAGGGGAADAEASLGDLDEAAISIERRPRGRLER